MQLTFFHAAGQEKKLIETQLPSGPVQFCVQLPPLKYCLPSRRDEEKECRMFVFRRHPKSTAWFSSARLLLFAAFNLEANMAIRG